MFCMLCVVYVMEMLGEEDKGIYDMVEVVAILTPLLIIYLLPYLSTFNPILLNFLLLFAENLSPSNLCVRSLRSSVSVLFYFS